jgi:putative heme iron utilization protein
VNDDVRQEIVTLVRTARAGALALLDADSQAPAVGRVGLATDTDGMPVFPVSALTGRDRAMSRDPRVSLLAGEAFDGDPLAHPRVSLSGRACRLTGSDRDRARRRYLARHPYAAQYIDFGDFSLWRLEVERAAFNGGFARAATLAGVDLTTAFADWPAWHAMEPGAVEHMNEDHADATLLYATEYCGAPPGAWRITGLDPEGIDMACGDDHRRLQFDAPLGETKDLRPTLAALARRAREQDLRAGA